LERKKTAAIFPAFGCKYLGSEKEILNEVSDDLRELLSRAEAAVDFDRVEFERRSSGDFEDELQSQYAAYIISCAQSNILKRSGIRIDYAAGYSMGLYAALFHAESVTFEQGLDLITVAYEMIRGAATGLDFGTGVISGLDNDDLRSIVSRRKDLEIINVNNRHSFLIAGFSSSVTRALKAAKKMGALNTKFLDLKLPYHSTAMRDVSREFYRYCSGLRIYDPACCIISTVDAREITAWEEVLGDLADNIYRNINWLAAMERMVAARVDAFVECGPGKSLYRISQFIEGGFSVYHLAMLQELLASDRVCSHADALDLRRA